MLKWSHMTQEPVGRVLKNNQSRATKTPRSWGKGTILLYVSKKAEKKGCHIYIRILYVQSNVCL